jgi:uncharacterized membrane protein YjfL (UPF0719 family)
MAQSHDAIPLDRVAELIGEAEPLRQSAVLHDAWREYVCWASRRLLDRLIQQAMHQVLMPKALHKIIVAPLQYCWCG